MSLPNKHCVPIISAKGTQINEKNKGAQIYAPAHFCLSNYCTLCANPINLISQVSLCLAAI